MTGAQPIPALQFDTRAAASTLAKLAGSVAVLACLSVLMIHFHITSYAYLAYALAGSGIIYAWTRPRWQSLAGTVALAAVFAAFYVLIQRESVLGTIPAFLGLGSLGSLSLAAIWRDSAQRQTDLETCLAAAMFPMFLIVSGLCLGMTTALHPKTLDLYLYAFDAQLGVQPSFLMGRFLSRFPLVWQICYLAYESLPLAMAVAFAMERSRRGQRRSSIMMAFIAAAMGGFFLYNLLPAAGPVHVFGKQFPFAPPAVGPLQAVYLESAPRNAMPSVHIAMALLILWNSRCWPKLCRVPPAGLLAATVMATLGFGEHYLVDLVVAVPFALAAQSLAATGLSWRTPARVTALVGGLAVVLAALLYLRLPAPPFAGSAMLVWTGLFSAAAASIYLESRLHRAA